MQLPLRAQIYTLIGCYMRHLTYWDVEYIPNTRAYVSSELYSKVLYEAASNISRCWVYSQYIQEPTSVVSCIQIWCYMRQHLTHPDVEYPLYIQEPTQSTEQYSNWVLVLVLVLYEAASDSRSTCLVCGFQTERRQRGEREGPPKKQLVLSHLHVASAYKIKIVCC